jgi:hypothetical protein
MERRRILLYTVASLGILGLVAALVPFVSSLQLNPRSGESLPRYNVADLHAGSARVLHPGGNRGYGTAVVVTRDLSGVIHAFWLFSSHGRTGVPGASWTVNFWCDDFGTRQVDESLETTFLTCKDEQFQNPELGQLYAQSRWTLTGKSLGSRIADLQPARFTVEHDEIVIGKRP